MQDPSSAEIARLTAQLAGLGVDSQRKADPSPSPSPGPGPAPTPATANRLSILEESDVLATSEADSDSDPPTTGVVQLALPRPDTSPTGHTGAPWTVPRRSGIKTDAPSTLRLYRLWLTGALDEPNGPSLDPSWDRRRVAAFWICASLMNHLTVPMKDTAFNDTRCALLVRVYILVHCLGKSINAANFVETVDELQEAVPESSVDVIATLLVDACKCPHTITPEITDEAFGQILNAKPTRDLEYFVTRMASTQRAFRLGSTKCGGGLNFICSIPPVPRILVSERAMSGAAYMSHLPLSDRFAHIFHYPETLWDPLEK